MTTSVEETVLHVMDVLVEAERTRIPVGPVSNMVAGGLTLELAHRVCEGNLLRRMSRGERLAGYKVGFTNIPVRDKMGLPDSTYGYLFDGMILQNGSAVAMDEFVAPRIETEICFRLGRDLQGPGLTVDDVLEATDSVCASFEICDARILDWKCPYPDFFADNGFSSRIVVSGAWMPVQDVDLLNERVVLSKDGGAIAEGLGAMALGHPANAVAWLSTKLAERGRGLSAGMVVMTGTLTPILPIIAGASYVGAFSSLGRVQTAFI